MSTEAVLERVRKLLALAASSTSEHEAAIAAGKADELIQQHRLTTEQLQGNATRESVVESDKPLWGGARMPSWVSVLAAKLARHYGCCVYTRRYLRGGRQNSAELRVIGLPSDVEIVHYLFAWLSMEVSRLAARRPRLHRMNYCLGAVVGIEKALQASRAKTDAAHTATHGASAALAVVNREEQAHAWANAAHGEMGKARGAQLSGGQGAADAFRTGVAAGQALPVAGKALPGANGRALPQKAAGA